MSVFCCDFVSPRRCEHALAGPIEPLYGIDGTAVDAHLEIQGRRPGGGRTDAADLHAAVHPIPAAHGRRGQISVEREVIGAVIEDDQGAEAAERIRIGDRPAVDRANGCPLWRLDLNTISDGGAAQTAGCLPEMPTDAPGDGPVERTAERRERNRDGFGRSATREVGDLMLEVVAGGLELAGELGGQIAPRVDPGDERGPGRDGTFGGRARLLRLLCFASSSLAFCSRDTRSMRADSSVRRCSSTFSWLIRASEATARVVRPRSRTSVMPSSMRA